MSSLFWRFFISTLVLTIIVYGFILQFLRKHLSQENFRGRRVPTGGGLVFLVTYIILISYYLFFAEQTLVPFRKWLLPLTILITTLGLLGFLDDIFGERGVGGFKGHFRELFKGHLTTGVIKAIGGGIISMIVASFFSPNYIALIVNGLLIALMSNIFNLLDLQPGRALKVFLILGIVIFLFSYDSNYWILSGIFLGSLIILLWADLTEACMLGDVGSNVLGGFIGFSLVVNLSWVVNAFVLLLVGLAHIYTESRSLSELVESNTLLRRLDELGRRREQRRI